MGNDGTKPAALTIEHLAFRYPGAARDIVRVGRFELRAGEQALLTGRSGSGKSTLLQLIAGLMDPSAGTIRVAGINVHGLAGAARDRFRGGHVGMIFQTFQLLQGFSALENVEASLLFSEAPAREHRPRATELLASLGIDQPGGRVEELSVGQQQRVAVARALAAKPALVLADEPTASLDPDNARGAMDLIQKACRDQGAALLCVSHDPAMEARFDTRARLGDLAT